MNNLEFDHADIFRDLADVQRTFTHLSRIVPRNGWIVLNGDDLNLRALGAMSWTRVIRVGMGEQNDVRVTDFSEDASGAGFSLSWQGKSWTTIRWALHGQFNARNAAMAATAAALAVQPENPAAFKLEALARFRGVKRRQEILINTPSLTVIEDFGHHPTALAETLSSFRARFKGATLTAVFEPRSNTARTSTMQSGFAKALALADEVYIGAVNRAEKLAANERFDTEAVAEHLAVHGGGAQAFVTNAELLEKLRVDTLPAPADCPRVVVFFTNGSFDGIIGKYVAAAKA
jgi:UDP-N-acetylmuramate: L-alanyl-gamma-D-glutamyl-meso-diaminopimelate ligase